MKSINGIFLLLSCFFAGCSTKSPQGSPTGTFTISRQEQNKRIDVLIDGKLFTAYRWPDSVFKPVLYPLVNAAGTEITRGYPLNPRPGERVDHPHHVGMWLNYGNVNGIDFWGNSLDIPEETRKKTGGIIRFVRAENVSSGKEKATMTVYNSWQDPSGSELLAEKTTFEFLQRGSVRIIDRATTLTATNGTVNFPDTKEGMFAIRVARQLELPSNESVTLTDANNRPTTVPQMSNEGVTGNYRSSEGVTGETVWGKRARWMNLFGVIAGDSVSVVICDHPTNPYHPTYWHARGYGLFSVNPFGARDFSAGKESFNFSLPQGKDVTFRYRVIISSGEHLSDAAINTFANEFASKN